MNAVDISYQYIFAKSANYGPQLFLLNYYEFK
jgi:hypothetical protein